jgi:hypothetical protein
LVIGSENEKIKTPMNAHIIPWRNMEWELNTGRA